MKTSDRESSGAARPRGWGAPERRGFLLLAGGLAGCAIGECRLSPNAPMRLLAVGPNLATFPVCVGALYGLRRMRRGFPPIETPAAE